MRNKEITKNKIYNKMYFNNSTIYEKQVSFDLSNGLTISVVKTQKTITNKQLKQRLYSKLYRLNKKLLLDSIS